MKRILFLTALASTLGAFNLIAKPHFGFGFNVNFPTEPVRHTTIIEQPCYEDVYVMRRQPVRVIRYATRPVVRRVMYQPRPSISFGFGIGHSMHCCF